MTRKIQIHTDDGDDTGATFAIKGDAIYFDSRGTTEGTRAYRAGLVLLLTRLSELGLTIRSVQVASRPALKLAPAKRELQLSGLAFPLDMAEQDPESVRRSFHTAAAKVGRPKGARGGGNGTKRLCIYLDQTGYSDAELESLLGCECLAKH